MCTGDGSVYNSTIDTDVCKDRYGIPYIPAKRIRGCLRECAGELADWGMDIQADDLFGAEGNKRSAVRIGNAYIKDYHKYINEIEANQDHMIFHPQNVLDQFAYIRTQTAIDNETGVADETTLRTIRVIKKGLTFVSEVLIMPADHDDEAGIVKEMEDCCSVLHHMGIARTRGYGEVCVKYEDEGQEANCAEGIHAPYKEGAEKLIYTIKLLDPMILKSVNGGEENTQDYIEGSKILGLVAQEMNKCGESIVDFFSGKNLFFSNAYICENGLRFTEATAILYDVKNHKEQYRNKLFDSKENREKYDKDLQINQMKHCYVAEFGDGEIRKINVDIE